MFRLVVSSYFAPPQIQKAWIHTNRQMADDCSFSEILCAKGTIRSYTRELNGVCPRTSKHPANVKQFLHQDT